MNCPSPSPCPFSAVGSYSSGSSANALVTPIATSTSSGTYGVTEYRALSQVLAYASQKQHTATEIVNNALIGGVATIFCDAQKRWENAVILPSTKCISTLAPLVSTGYFCPSQTLAVDKRATRVAAVTESCWRDLFHVSALLFPDCFVDGPLLNHDRDRIDINVELSIAPSRASISPMLGNGAQQQRLPQHSPSPMPAGALFSSSTATAATTSLDCTLTLAQSATATSSSSSGAVARVDLLEMHAIRMRVAAMYLSSINDGLNDVQVRLLRENKDPPSSATKEATKTAQSAAAVVAAPPLSAERSVLITIVQYLLKTKMMLLCCMFAAEAAYVAPPDIDSKGGGDGNGNSNSNNSSNGNTFSMVEPLKSVVLYPVHSLIEASGTYFFDPVETWLWDGNVEEWYDRMLATISDLYSGLPHRPARTTFAQRLSRIKDDALVDGRAITHSPQVVLFGAADCKQPITTVAPVTVHATMLKLPRLSVQPGELQLLPPMRAPQGVELLLDGTPSPFISFIVLASTRKLSEAQMSEETARLAARPWREMPQVMVEAIMASLDLKEGGTLQKLLEKNPVMLARIVMWGLHGSPHPEKFSCTHNTTTVATRDGCESFFESTVEDYVLFSTPFSVEVGQYLKEVLTHTALPQERFEKWLHHCQEVLQPSSPHARTIAALSSFASAQCGWKLEQR